MCNIYASTTFRIIYRPRLRWSTTNRSRRKMPKSLITKTTFRPPTIRHRKKKSRTPPRPTINPRQKKKITAIRPLQPLKKKNHNPNNIQLPIYYFCRLIHILIYFIFIFYTCLQTTVLLFFSYFFFLQCERLLITIIVRIWNK